MGRKNKSRHPWQYSARIPNSERPKCNGLEFIRKALTVSAAADSGQNNANHPRPTAKAVPTQLFIGLPSPNSQVHGDETGTPIGTYSPSSASPHVCGAGQGIFYYFIWV